MDNEATIKGQLEEAEVQLSERLGQHFLTEPQLVKKLSDLVIPGAKVIEVGSGIGHVTKALAHRAERVVGIEIDKRFQPILEKIENENPKINFIIRDVLDVSFAGMLEKDQETQIFANLPFHITEPFMGKLMDLPVANIVMIMGDNIAREFQEREDSLSFGKMSLLAQTFFNVRILQTIPKTSFYPQPRTDAVLIELEPKEKKEIEMNPANYIFAYLLRRESKNTLVVNDLKQALVESSSKVAGVNLSKQESHQKERSNIRRELTLLKRAVNNSGASAIMESSPVADRRNDNLIVSQGHSLEVIQKIGIPDEILSKPFSRLDNQELRALASLVRSYFR